MRLVGGYSPEEVMRRSSYESKEGEEEEEEEDNVVDGWLVKSMGSLVSGGWGVWSVAWGHVWMRRRSVRFGRTRKPRREEEEEEEEEESKQEEEQEDNM